jgi:hypothetical protein
MLQQLLVLAIHSMFRSINKLRCAHSMVFSTTESSVRTIDLTQSQSRDCYCLWLHVIVWFAPPDPRVPPTLAHAHPNAHNLSLSRRWKDRRVGCNCPLLLSLVVWLHLLCSNPGYYDSATDCCMLLLVVACHCVVRSFNSQSTNSANHLCVLSTSHKVTK